MRDRCKTFRRAYLLEEPLADEAHPSGCAECRRFVEDEREVVALVRAHRPAWEAPPSLRERVTAVLEAERARRRRPERRRRVIFAAVVLPLLVAFALVLAWPRNPDARRRAEATADLVVRDYLEYARRDDKLQYASASPTELQAWFENDVQLAAKVPALSGARLLGGRRCSLGGRPAALAFYELRGQAGQPPETVSLFVFEARGEDWSGMHEVRGLAGKRACQHHQQGVGVVVWEERGLVYALAAALDASSLVGLLD